MPYRLNRISLWSVARTAFVVCALTGFAFGIFYGLILAVAGQVIRLFLGNGAFSEIGMVSGIAGVFASVFFAMISGVIGTLFALLAAWLYNITAHLTGGIEFDAEIAPVAFPVSVSGPETTVPQDVPSDDLPAASPEK